MLIASIQYLRKFKLRLSRAVWEWYFYFWWRTRRDAPRVDM